MCRADGLCGEDERGVGGSELGGGPPVFDDEGRVRLINYEYGLIHKKVGQLLGKYGYTRSDREDLFQELVTHLVTSLLSYDAAKGCRKSFATAVVERYVVSLLRKRCAQRRQCSEQSARGPSGTGCGSQTGPECRRRRVQSLSALGRYVPEGEENHVDVEQHHLDDRRLAHPRDQHDQDELVMDVAKVLADLPPDAREIAEALMRAESTRDLARARGVPESTLRGQISALRKRFERSHLSDHL